MATSYRASHHCRSLRQNGEETRTGIKISCTGLCILWVSQNHQFQASVRSILYHQAKLFKGTTFGDAILKTPFKRIHHVPRVLNVRWDL